MRHLFIINPTAGKPETTARLERQIAGVSFPHEVVYTGGEGDALRFARAAAALYGDPEACGRLSRKAQTYVRSHYSMDAAWEVIREDFEEA